MKNFIYGLIGVLFSPIVAVICVGVFLFAFIQDLGKFMAEIIQKE